MTDLYFKELGVDTQVLEAANIILTPDKAKLFYYEFIVGSNKMKFYGNPAIMLMYSELIHTLLPSIADEPVVMAENFDLTEINIRSFTYLWLYMKVYWIIYF